MEFSQIPVEKLSDVWLALAPFLEKALAYSDNESTLEDVYADVFNETSQLWAVHSDAGETIAVGVTRIALFPRKKICLIQLFSGNDLQSMMHLWPRFEAWARGNGCTDIDWYGRPGFKKLMKNEGYEQKYIVMRKNITLPETIH